MPIPRAVPEFTHGFRVDGEKAGDHPRNVSVPACRRARRRMFRNLGYGTVPGLAPICCDTNDPDTIQNGFAKRLMREVPVAAPSRLVALERFVQSYLAEHIPKAKQLGFEEWLDRTSYNEARKQELRLAWLELRGGRPSRRVCSRIKSFVKTESYPEYKHCRLINSRSDAFKVFSGPLFKAIEDVVYDLPEFIKHVPVPERPAKVRALRQAGRKYYQTDFTAFESHFSPEVMQSVELALYRHCLSWCPDDAELICRTLAGKNCMSLRSGVRASCHGRRMSGDMCTSLGNGFTNLMIAKFLAFEQGQELFGFVEGDDGLFATEAVLTSEQYEALGFTIKIDEVADPCDASFCGMVFAESGEIVRHPVDFLANFGWTSSFISAGPRIMNELLRAKALSAVYETPQCPIVGKIARLALVHTRGYCPRWVEDGYHSHILVPRDERGLPAFQPSPDTRELFHRKFGVTPDNQRRIEAMLEAGNFDVAPLLNPHSHYAHYEARYVEVG